MYFYRMFQIEKTLVSEELIKRQFVCDLEACKGVCCVAGDAGAPLDKDELNIIEEIYPKVKPFLREEGVKAIEEQGLYTTNEDGEYETTLINGADCAYVIFDDKKTALCAFEEAYNQGVTDFKKPISCHLYPVRIRDYTDFCAVNYDYWPICDAACALGGKLQVPVYKFLKQSLIRKFGESWYEELDLIAQNYKK